MASVEADLATESKRTHGLHSQLQLAQDRVAEARAAATAAEVDLKSAEEKVADLTDSLASAKEDQDHAVADLRQQHVAETQVYCFYAAMLS